MPEFDELGSLVQSKAQEVWRWIVPCQHSHQIVTHTVGDRSQQSACELCANLPSDHRRRATRNDFWLAYAAAFPRRTHRVYGKKEGETNHNERFFGTIRACLSRPVRRSYAFSKCVERHLDTTHPLPYQLQCADQANNNPSTTSDLPSHIFFS